MVLVASNVALRRSNRCNKCQTKLIDNNDSWIQLPIRVTRSGTYEYNWVDFEIKFNTKGLAIYTTTYVKAGKLLPYGGKYITSAELAILMQQNKERITYIVATNDPHIFYDAHPSNYPNSAPKYGWLGSMVNQPTITLNECANCELIMISKQHQLEIPKYPYIKNPMEVALEITQDLNPGVELLTNYNWDYRATRWLNMQKCHIQKKKNKMKMKQIGNALTKAKQNKNG